ncbi:diguanylate cyclase (GGDEF)-like protein [Paenibacillus phyllosphaerae]|uniref:Diguanylate cyclase (GGDEF)-like protein n=1 Tax=Paenibacillus phyllosphaerae TaxID=274593 RepID=A0A7W5B0J4_9BACL|nr:bifunctional diguanylate cyclase/phosphodiesterase [Paenibacillus phyllosphaerae]MBB3112189.1 diguanylate cyclase (GGDEF)-like protein [Paenibacillus phyllosphaerae]
MDARYPVLQSISEGRAAAGWEDFDRLTGLPGRMAAFTLLGQALSKGRANEVGVIVAVVDFDRFHLINESRGTVFGDEALKQLGRRFQSKQLSEYTTCRIGGNTFLLFRFFDNEQLVSACTADLKAKLEVPLQVGGQMLYPTCSIGLAECPKHGLTAERLMRHAETALQQAKAAGGNRIGAYTEADANRASRRMELEGALRDALSGGQLSLNYQPIYEASGRLRGFEALLRWTHPELGFVSPAEFVPLAEQTGLIVLIGEWVIREACRMYHEAAQRGLTDIVMAVNLSPLQLRVPAFVETILFVLRESGTPPQAIELEITESVMIDAGEATVAALEQLRDAGVRIALDDFGTGYASLTYLRELPLHTLKLDRSFINHICKQHPERVIVESMISLVHRLGLEVVAEGIEDYDQLLLLREWGCDFMQGYLLGKPIQEAEVGPHLMELVH